MKSEEEIRKDVVKKLKSLGYQDADIRLDFRLSSSRGGSLDILIEQEGDPYLVVEIKNSSYKLPVNSPEELMFNPSIRQAQFFTQQLKAPYFLVTNGDDYLWFEVTNEIGRPGLLNDAVFPKTIETSKISDQQLVSVFRYLMNYLKSELPYSSGNVSLIDLAP